VMTDGSTRKFADQLVPAHALTPGRSGGLQMFICCW
jgi:hypothetical protein